MTQLEAKQLLINQHEAAILELKESIMYDKQALAAIEEMKSYEGGLLLGDRRMRIHWENESKRFELQSKQSMRRHDTILNTLKAGTTPEIPKREVTDNNGTLN